MLMAALELMQGLAEMPVGCVEQSHREAWGGVMGWRGLHLHFQFRLPAAANTLEAVGKRHLAQDLVQPARSRPGTYPTPEESLVGRQ